jgi:putative aldouronate transport system substrate-binding protein
MATKEKRYMVSSCLLIFALAITGCSGNNDSNGKNMPAVSSSATVDKASSELPPYELTMAFFTLGSQTKGLPEVEAAVNAITKKKINATVKFVPISYGSWIQQTNLMLASNEKLDLLISGVNGNYATLAAQKQILPLNKLFDKYGPNIKKSMYPFMLEAVKISGEMYGIPSKRDFASGRALYMRKDIVDKYKIDLSKYKTFSELDSLFQTIKDNEPNMTPVVSFAPGAAPVGDMTLTVFDPLGNNMGSMNKTNDDKKVINMFESKEYADMVKIVRRWFEKGFIRKDEATSKDAGLDLVKAGKAFSYFSTWKPGNETQYTRQTGTEMVSILLGQPSTDSSQGGRFNWSIAKNSKNPERAMMLLDLLFADKELINLFSWGIENRDYVKKSDNIIAYPTGIDANNVPYGLNQGWMFGDQYQSYVFETDPSDIWSLMDKHNLNSQKSPATGFNYDSSAVKSEVAAITNVLNQYKVGLETGTLDPNAVLPDFNKKLKDAGIEKIIADKQKQFDEWSKTK